MLMFKAVITQQIAGKVIKDEIADDDLSYLLEEIVENYISKNVLEIHITRTEEE